jgi:hypothetical protein
MKPEMSVFSTAAFLTRLIKSKKDNRSAATRLAQWFRLENAASLLATY